MSEEFFKELLQDEKFKYALAEALAERMFDSKVFEVWSGELDWTTQFAKIVRESVSKKVEAEIDQEIKRDEIEKQMKNAIYKKLGSIIDSIKKEQSDLEIVF